MYSKGNKPCRRFVAIFNESVPVTPPRNPALKFVKVFKYIGTRRNHEGSEVDVFLSTNTNGNNNHYLFYNYGDYNKQYNNSFLGWIGSVILNILIIVIMVSN